MLRFLLPNREAAILRSIDGQLPRPDALKISIARSQDDFIGAAKLVYESYQRRGIPFTHKSELRILPQIMAGNSVVVIARSGESVIGTLTLLTRNPFGFFMSEILSEEEKNSHFAVGHSAFSEIASLAINPKYLAPASSLFYELMSFAYQFSKNFMDVQNIVTMAQPGVVQYYNSLFGFKPIGGDKPRPVASLGGDLNVPLTVSIEDFEKTLESNAKKFIAIRPLTKLILSDALTDKTFEYPTEKLTNGMYSIKSVSVLEELFMKKTEIMIEAPADIRARVAAQYPTTDDYLWVFQTDPRIKKRRSRRFSVDLPTSIAVRSDGNGMSIRNGRILDISENGIRLELLPSQAPLPTAGEITVTIPVSDTTETSVHGEIVRSDVDQRSYGIQITDCSRSFLDYIRHLATVDNANVA